MLDSKLSWECGKFQLTRWSQEVVSFHAITTHPPPTRQVRRLTRLYITRMLTRFESNLVLLPIWDYKRQNWVCRLVSGQSNEHRIFLVSLLSANLKGTVDWISHFQALSCTFLIPLSSRLGNPIEGLIIRIIVFTQDYFESYPLYLLNCYMVSYF